MSRFERSTEKKSVEVGYYNATIVDFLDITERLKQWGDWSFEMHLNVENVPFDIKTTFIIKFDKLSNGELDPDGNRWASQFNNMLDAIEYYGGFDRFGVFRDESGEEVDRVNILETLLRHLQDKFPDGYPFLVYLEKDKKGYMRPMKRIYQHKDKADLENFVNFKQSKQQPTKSINSTMPIDNTRRL